MKRISLLVLALFMAFISSAQTIDDIQNKLMELASQSDRLELPRLFSQYKDEVEPYVRYYCGMIIYTNNGNNKEALTYIDSLLVRTPYIFEKRDKAAVACIKAKILQQEQHFEDLADFCEAFIAGEQMAPGDYLEKELQAYRVEGVSKRATATIRERLMWFANYGNPFELKAMYEANKDSVDSYIQLNYECAMAQSFNDNKTAIARIDSLLNFYSSRMDTVTTLNNIRRKAEILFQEGMYNALAEYVENIPVAYKSSSVLNDVCQWAALLKGTSSAEIIRSPEDCIISDLLFTNNIPLLPGTINGTDCRFLLNTGIPFTVIKGSLAQASKIKILPDSVKTGWYFGEDYPGVFALIDSLKLGDILFKNRIAFIDTSSVESFGDHIIYLGASEIRAVGQIDFYPDKIVFPYNSTTEKEEPNFYLEDSYVKVLCFVGEKSDPFVFNTGFSTSYLAASALWRSGQSVYDTKITIGKKTVPFTAFSLNNDKNLLGYSFVESFPKFSINYNTMRIDFDVASVQMPQIHWAMRGDFFELEKELKKNKNQNKDYCYYYKAFVENGKNRPTELLCLLDSVLNNISEYNKSSVLLHLRTMQEHAYYDSGQYEDTYTCLSEMKSICPEALLTSLEKACNRCELLRTTPPQQIVWNASQACVKSTMVADDKFYYPLKINGKEASVNIALDALECVISMKEAQLLGVKIFDDFVYFNDVVSKLGVAETIQIGEMTAKNVIFYVLLDDNAPTVLGQSLLRHISTIELSKDQIVLQKESPNNEGELTPLHLDEHSLSTQLNSSKGSLVVRLVAGNENVVPHSFSTAKDLQVGGIPINVTDCHLDKNLDTVVNMNGTIGLYYLLQQTDRVIFDFKNMTVASLK